MEQRNNRVINEIMANSSSSIIVLSSSDCEYTSFLSELSNRYPTTFWFNAKYDNSFSFSLELAHKVIRDETIFFKLLQYKYCDNEKIDNIIINVVLDDIKKRQGDCLLVFDHLEVLPDNFDFSLIELLIRNCPKNLKLIFITEKLIDINYNKLEDLAPKIVDEFALGAAKVRTTDIDTRDLTPSDIHFLAYVSALDEVPMDFASSIYQKGVGVLRYASIKFGNLVTNKNNNGFSVSRTFHDIMAEKSKNLGTSPFTRDIILLLYDYLTQKGKHLNALCLGIEYDNFTFIKNSLSVIINEWGLLYRLWEMARYKSYTINDKYVTTDYPECYFYSAFCDYAQGRCKEALKKMDKLLTVENLSTVMLKVIGYYKTRLLAAMGEHSKGVEFVTSVVPDCDPDNIGDFDYLLCALPSLMHNLDLSVEVEKLKKCERLVQCESCTQSYLYVKILQSLSEAFFDLGNYRKAITLVQKIKSLLPFYIVPHKMLQYFYYMNDLVYAERIALTALQKAKEYYITTDLASVYCLLYKIYAYWGMKKEALQYIEMAINCEESNDFIKYYAIALRVIGNARFSKKEFPKDIAIIYARQCEQTFPRYACILYGSVAYWYWHNKRKDEAIFFANKCLKGNARTGVWLVASGVAINYAIEDESQDMKQIVTKFFYTAEQYAMDMVLVDYDTLFSGIIKYAYERNFVTPYIEKINNLIKNKVRKEDTSVKVKIHAMGGVSVLVNGNEIEWKTKKSRELFMIYALRGAQGIDRLQIFSLLWGEYIYESAINNLKTNNNIIRNTLTKYNVDYSLEYKNGKYVLSLANFEFDYLKYLRYIEKFNAETVLSDKIGLMLDIIEMYGTGFAPELTNAEIKEIRQTTKTNLCIMLVEFIKLLVDKGRVIDANKFMTHLSRIDDTGKYTEMITGYEERKHI